MPAKISEASKHSILINTSIVSFLTSFTASSINIAIPAIAIELHLSSIMAGWISSAYLLILAVFLLSFGKLSDLKGRKILYLTGIVIFIASSLASALSVTGMMLIISRAVQGLGVSMLFACSIPILISAYPPNKRGKVLGVSVACVYAGLSMGPFLGGIITQHFGWHALFYFLIAAMIPVFIMTIRTIPSDRKKAEHSFDITGSIIYGFCILAGILGLSRIVHIDGKVMLLSGIVLLIIFLLYENRQKYPLIPVHDFSHNKVFIFSNLAAMIHYSATFSVSFFISLYLQHVTGFTPAKAGSIMMVQPVFQVIFSPLSGKLSDTRDPKILASTGIGITALALAGIAFYPGLLPIPFIIALLALLGIGLALFSSPNNNAILGSVDHAHVGIASSVLGTMRVIGQNLSMAIAILLLTHFIGTREIESADISGFISSFKTAFTISALLCIAGIFCSLMRGKKESSHT